MDDPKDSDSQKQRPTASKEPTAVGEQGGSKRSGRVAFDARGNTVWEWQLETGVYTRDVNTQKLKKLDLGELSIAETAIQRRPEGLAEPQTNPMPGGGFNPYDSGPKATGANPYDNARWLAGRGSTPAQDAQSARKPTDLRKLDEWMKLKNKLKDTKQD